MSDRYNVFKIVILGDGAVGKTTTINALDSYITSQGKMKTSDKHTQRTKFIDFQTIYNNQGPLSALQVWDCQGQRFNHNHPLDLIKPTILELSSLIILMFALDDSTTLENILLHDGWLEIIEPIVTKNNIPVILLGNKADRPGDVFEDYIKKKVQSISCIKNYLAISSITGIGIPELAGLIHNCLIEQSKKDHLEYVDVRSSSAVLLPLQSSTTI